MSKSGKDTTIAIQPGGAGTWGTASAPGANDGILPASIDQLALQGNVAFDETIGMTQLQYADMMLHEANPTIILPLRWNGMHWAFLANIMGDSTKTGAGPTYVNTMNYQEESALVQITMAAEIGSDGDIIEWPSLKVQAISLEPDGDGFWQMTVTTLGNTILYDSDATTATSDFNAVTFASKVQRMRYKALSLK